MVKTPVKIQVKSNPPAEPVYRAMSAATMKMPEPIIEPTTIIVASKRPIRAARPDVDVFWGTAPCGLDEFIMCYCGA